MKTLITKTAAPLLALAALVACSEGLQEVREGDMRCEEPCEMRIAVGDPQRDSYGKLTVTNSGLGELQILDVYIENSSPYVQFTDGTLTNLIDLSDFGWEFDPATQSFNTNGESITMSPSELLEVELKFRLPSGGTPIDCPSGDPGACGFIVIESNDRHEEDRVVRVPIQITIGEGIISVDPSIVDFPDPTPGETYEGEFDVVNNGTGELTVTGWEVSGAANVDVQSASNFPPPIRVQPAGRHTFVVRWSPTTTDDLSGSVLIQSDSLDGSVGAVALRSGAGSDAVLSVVPCGIDFTDTAVGEPSEQLFDVSNNGGAAMTWSMSLTGFAPTDARNEFVLRNNNGDSISGEQPVLQAGQSRTYSLEFTPTAERSVSGTIRFTGNFGARQECTFSAGPAAPEIAVSPNRLYWGGVAMGATEPRSFVVYNTGRATLNVTSLTLQENGDVNEEFSLDGGVESGFTLEPGASRRVRVTYSRAASDVDAPDTATVTIQHNDPLVAPLTVRLEANHGETLLPPSCVITLRPEEPYSVGQTVTLDATETEPAEGTTLAANPYQWTLVPPAGSTSTLSGGTGDTVTLAFDEPGTYEVGLTATAELGAEQITCEVLRNLLVTE